MALNITKGERFKSEYQQFPDGTHVCVATHEGDFVADFGLPTPENEANAELFADSLNTANKTGLLPSELAELNEKLKEIIEAFGKSCFYKGFEKAIKDDANRFTAWREEAGELLAKFKQFQFPSIEQPAPLTLSEADEAMDNGHKVAYKTWGDHNWIAKKNGFLHDRTGVFESGETNLSDAFGNRYQTGWRIVKPNNQ